MKPVEKKHNVRLRVLDARPIINAKGNALMGKGHEVIARLGGTECTTLKFANIENIHAMRASYLALRKACAAANDVTDDWNHAVHESKWLHHISDVLKGSIYLATHLERGDPCLCHCSGTVNINIHQYD
jgi:myotubularin-related protein 1/2